MKVKPSSVPNKRDSYLRSVKSVANCHIVSVTALTKGGTLQIMELTELAEQRPSFIPNLQRRVQNRDINRSFRIRRVHDPNV